MTVRDNPVKRIMVVQKIGGKLVIDVQGTVQVPFNLKLRSVSFQKMPAIFSGLRRRNGVTSSVTPIEAA
jgi:hypothetical protein